MKRERDVLKIGTVRFGESAVGLLRLLITSVSTTLLLVTFSGNALSQTNSDEPSIFFHAGSSEQLASLCRAVDEVEAMVGSKTTVGELIRVSKRAGLCIGVIKATIDSDIIAHTDQAGHVTGRDVCVPTEASEKRIDKSLDQIR
jgi:hypothetical protein